MGHGLFLPHVVHVAEELLTVCELLLKELALRWNILHHESRLELRRPELEG